MRYVVTIAFSSTIVSVLACNNFDDRAGEAPSSSGEILNVPRG